jgi:outer membrane murein-binding lipoprotein Lpp
MSTGMSRGTGTAHDAGVSTVDHVDEVVRDPKVVEYLNTYADQCERAVEAIEAKAAGIAESLEAARQEAARARAEVDAANGEREGDR